MPKNSKTPVEAAVDAAVAKADTLTIHEAAAVSGLSEQYIRKAIRKGDLETVKVATTDSGKTWRHEILGASFRAWRETSGTKTSREDGRSKFVLYMTPDEVKAFAEKVSGEPFATTLARAYNKKTAAPTEA
jgi:hypothetical protein